MLLRASSLRNDDVTTVDDEKLGTVVNVIFEADSSCPIAYLLVFPHEKNWFLKQISDNWGGIATGFVERNLPELPPGWDEIKKKGTGEAQRVWNAYVKDNAQKRQLANKICYLILVSEIDEQKLHENQIALREKFVGIRDNYCYVGEPQVSDTLVPLYATVNIPVRDNLLPVTLNLQPVFQRLKVWDSNRNPGWILDVQLDTEQRVVSDIIVQVAGKDAGDYLVNPADFDFSTLTSTKPFNQFPKLPP
jgi:sporulation protein YlmC with PRC-barrel domain